MILSEYFDSKKGILVRVYDVRAAALQAIHCSTSIREILRRIDTEETSENLAMEKAMESLFGPRPAQPQPAA
jgi:hypothetical protein